MSDLIKRDDALAAVSVIYKWSIAAAEELETAIRAMPAVTVEVKPLVWHDWGFTYHAFDPIDGQTIHAETKEDIDRIEAERQQRILSALEPQPTDPAAIREAALREAYEVVYKWWFGNGPHLPPQELILALIGEMK